MLNIAAKFVLSWILMVLPMVQGWLGIYLDEDSDKPKVVEVVPDSPAASAGLKVGDVMLSVDETATPSREAFIAAIHACEPNQRVRLKVARGGQEMLVLAKLGERPAEDQMPAAVEVAPPKQGGGAPAGESQAAPKPQEPARKPSLGLQLQITGDRIEIAGVVEGSPAAKQGIAAGEVLRRWNGTPISTLEQIEAATIDIKAGDIVKLTVEGKDGPREVSVAFALPAKSPQAKPEGEDAAAAKKLKQAKRSGAKAPAKDQTAPESQEQRGKLEVALRATKPKIGTDFAAALAAAKASGQRVLVIYGSELVPESLAQREALSEPEVAELLGEVVCVYVDAGANQALLEERDVQQLPTVELLRNGKTERRHEGYLPPQKLAGLVRGPKPKQVQDKAMVPPPPMPPKSAAQDPQLQAELAQLRQELVELRRQLEQLKQELRKRE